MKDSDHKSTTGPSSSLDMIKEVKFTPREIDVLACLLAGRSAKKIAFFLSISPKTVENYIHNITQKLSCNSREGIIDFLESSDKVLEIKHHYSNLLLTVTFEQRLKDISPNIRKELLALTIFSWQRDEEINSLLSQLENYFRLSGINVVIENLNAQCTMDSIAEEMDNRSEGYALYIILNAA